MSSIIKLENIVKKFYIGEPNELEILHGISLEVEEGEFVSIVGPSGSGKSTLMNMIGALDRPTSGNYILDGINVEEADDTELSEIRNQKIGFVFQTYNLVSKTNALKNVELPMLYSGVDRSTRIKRAKELLDLVEMRDRAKHLPEELSGGQKQRVAIARAMANDPAIILADEPTGALDSKTGRLVMDLFHKLNKENNKTIILITHSEELASETDRIISLKDGMIVDIRPGNGKIISKENDEINKNVEKSNEEVNIENNEKTVIIEKNTSEETSIENVKDETVDNNTIEESNTDNVKNDAIEENNTDIVKNDTMEVNITEETNVKDEIKKMIGKFDLNKSEIEAENVDNSKSTEKIEIKDKDKNTENKEVEENNENGENK